MVTELEGGRAWIQASQPPGPTGLTTHHVINTEASAMRAFRAALWDFFL